MDTFRFEAIGTDWEIAAAQPLGWPLRRRILERIRQFDRTYSRFRRDSLVARVAVSPDGGRFDFPEDSVALFDLYQRLHAMTGGAVDPLVGRDLELLGYDRTYSLTPAPDGLRAEVEARGRPRWSTDVARDGTSLVTRRPLVIDVGAAGKGYLVDIVSGILRDAGLSRFVVDASGDLRHSGGPGIRVGLEHPQAPGRVIGVVSLQGRALCASATTRRAWGDGLHHVLDARTGVPVHDVLATWVVADEAATADGLATALFFTSPEPLREAFRFSYVRMLADGRVEVSPDFDGELFLASRSGRRGRPPGHHGAAAARPPPGGTAMGMTTLGRRLGRTAMAAISASILIAPCWPTGTATVPAALASDDRAIRSGPAARSDSAYTDGVYTATAQYGSVPSFITVTVTLVQDVITDVTVTPHATNETSLELQRRFAAAVPAVVVGKRIDEVNVGRLAGSSGTPRGFNTAIRRIREQARTGTTASE